MTEHHGDLTSIENSYRGPWSSRPVLTGQLKDNVNYMYKFKFSYHIRTKSENPL